MPDKLFPTPYKLVHTFSIAAYDPQKREWGVAVQSKFLAAAAVVSWARANAGAVATQSYANLTYGSRGLDLMEEGVSAADTILQLIETDDEKDQRQVGLVDRDGNAAAYTGEKCLDWAGHIVGDGYTCQGNILIPGTIEAMAARYEAVSQGEGELADWLVEALEAAQEAGGDKRGRQAAGVLVVRENGGYGGNNDRYLDLRVDDHPFPVLKLKQLVETHHLYFGKVAPEDLIPLASVVKELQGLMAKTGHYQGELTGAVDQETLKALKNLVAEENLEERWNGDEKAIDRKVVEYLRDQFS
jgi:uncharacterized Ntn-hydrolase superfamily protein